MNLPGQLPLFPLSDVDLGELAKAIGQGQAMDKASLWAGEAFRAIALLAGTGTPFTSEDVIAEVGLPSGAVQTNGNNAVGAIMSAAAREGIIRPVARVKTQRATSHAHSIIQWVGTYDSD